MTDTEPLDLDALISGSNDLVVEAREYLDVLIIANRKPGPSSVDIMSRQADALEALIAEVRRLREEAKTLANGLERVYELSEDPDGNSNEIRDAISEVADEALVAAGRMLPDGATR